MKQLDKPEVRGYDISDDYGEARGDSATGADSLGPLGRKFTAPPSLAEVYGPRIPHCMARGAHEMYSGGYGQRWVTEDGRIIHTS